LEEALTNMKNTLLILASLAMTSGLASASTVFCAGVTSLAGNSTFTGATLVPGAGGTASTSGATATLTCTGLGVVPVNEVLSSITIGVDDDAQSSTDANSAVTWTWTQTGGPVVTGAVASTVNFENSTGNNGFNSCVTSTAGSPAVGCDDFNTFGLVTPQTAGSSIANLVFTVVSAAVNGDGVSPIGSSSAGLFIGLNFTPANNPTPEPTTFALVGGALLGLGLLRKKATRA
jgi:hypothetical protein